ncbi:uncharacterized protein LOC108624680 isoform X2 [Ceratina calcarata]|uniref:Uncharacterized protein LOC108624680 isoform X2 n=1 Tax=Ceratina calcarata TaxID=156304 RepID=A0AAJ7IYG2_9HYME|nr:uncharacterized protein LOC108624680 isoform X2 [Ceratina calcarata]
MTENFHDEIVFRGSKKAKDNERSTDVELDNKIFKGRLHLRRWLIALLILLFITLIILNTYSMDQFRAIRYGAIINDSAQENYVAELKSTYSGFLVNSNACRIPYVDPFDSKMLPFYKKMDPLICKHGSHLPLVDSNNTAIYINPNAISHFYNDSKEINCCWRAIHRVQHEDNDVKYDTECHKFVNSATITDTEYVKVECSQNKTMVYKDVFAFLPRFPSLEKKYKKKKTDYLNVLIIGIDSVSRNNFHRMMPKTVEMLKKYGAVELLGYTKVGENTFPNLVPVYSGLSISELEKLCWPKRDKTFDDCPFIWQNFSASGYRTIFAEDACSISTFNYLKRGFRDPPTDYYLRPYCIASEKEIGNTRPLNAMLCLGTRKWYDQLLSYAKKAAIQFIDDPYFAISWQTSLTHDYWTYPQWGDQSYADFVAEMFNEKLLEKTVLIFMSDHGMRWGPFRQTYQGRMEDSLPFLFIMAPRWWRAKHEVAWANLRRNTRRLTTPYDLHETLKDLLDYKNLKESSLKNRTKATSAGKQLPRGISLFLPIPDYRTCATAGIPSRWCMCHNSYEISTDDNNVRDMAFYLVSTLNEMLKKFAQCAILKLKEIRNAKAWKYEDDDRVVDYTIVIETEPGNAIFEATIRHETNKTDSELVGAVSRLNLYGQQSACVNDYNMRLYCYCL